MINFECMIVCRLVDRLVGLLSGCYALSTCITCFDNLILGTQLHLLTNVSVFFLQTFLVPKQILSPVPVAARSKP